MSQLSPEATPFAAIAEAIRTEIPKADRAWDASPFGWLRTLPSRTRGAVGEKLVARWFTANGFRVRRCPDAEADLLVGGIRVEVKFSTLWKTGSYVFQQLRDQRYDIVICLGISPFDAHCWMLTKNEVMGAWRHGRISSQHGGSRGRDTAWLQVKPASPPAWLEAFGGSPGVALRRVRELVERLRAN